MAIVYKNGRYEKVTAPKRGTKTKYGVLKGKVIKTSAKLGYFIQVDKNSQICNIFKYDRSLPPEERVGDPVRGSLFDMYVGQPLFKAFKNIIETVTR